MTTETENDAEKPDPAPEAPRDTAATGAGGHDAPTEEPPAGEGDVRPKPPKQKPGEIGGPEGPEPTRYGDWEIGGRCSDF